jgi:thymidylate synthase
VDRVFDVLVQQGTLGVALAALGYAFWRQSGDLKTTQEARVADANRMITVMLDLNNKNNEAIGQLTAAVSGLENAIERRRI